MRRTLTLLFMICLSAMPARGQHNLVTGATIDWQGGRLCTDTNFGVDGPISSQCNESWLFNGSNGTGSDLSTANYGVLEGVFVFTTEGSADDGREFTSGGVDSAATDTLTFTGLNGNAFLKVTGQLYGRATGTFSVTAGVDLSNFTTLQISNCEISSSTGTCSATIPISPIDTVRLHLSLGVGGEALVPGQQNVLKTSAAYYDSAHAGGFYVALQVVDAKGRDAKGAAVVAMSGTTYPTRPNSLRPKPIHK